MLPPRLSHRSYVLLSPDKYKAGEEGILVFPPTPHRPPPPPKKKNRRRKGGGVGWGWNQVSSARFLHLLSLTSQTRVPAGELTDKERAITAVNLAVPRVKGGGMPVSEGISGDRLRVRMLRSRKARSWPLVSRFGLAVRR